MRMSRTLLVLALGSLVAGATLLAQDAAMGPPPPTPEHAMLTERVGTWDAAFKYTVAPGQVMEDKASMTFSMLGEYWLVGDYRGNFMGSPFQGKELTTYNTETKEFQSFWIDSTSHGITEMRGSYDSRTRVLTMTSTTPDPMSGVKSVNRWTTVDADTVTMTMTPEGATDAVMEITYTRKK